MTRKHLLLLSWFPMALILLLVNLSFLARSASAQKLTEKSDPVEIESLKPDESFVQVAVSQEGTSKVLGAEIVADDARVHLVENFLAQHESPMTPYAQHIIYEADANGIDFRLVIAIAMCESNLGKKMPAGSYNAWGIAVYTGEKSGATFNGWPQAITWVSRYIKEHYYDRGLVDLKDIGAIYAPPSVDTEYSWTRCVEKFQNSIN